jgi:hypothetical protein
MIRVPVFGLREALEAVEDDQSPTELLADQRETRSRPAFEAPALHDRTGNATAGRDGARNLCKLADRVRARDEALHAPESPGEPRQPRGRRDAREPS